MQTAWFTDPCFKTSFLDEPEAAAVDSCIQEALKLAAAHVREEAQSTSSISTTKHSHRGIRGEKPGWVSNKDYLFFHNDALLLSCVIKSSTPLSINGSVISP